MTIGATQQRWAIDSIEEQVASIEVDDGTLIRLPHRLLPDGAKEGDVLRVSIEVDRAETNRALAASAEQVKQGSEASRKRDSGGDIVL